jgi:enoyl-CoA hydratase
VSGGIVIRVDGRAGRITLNRPQVLNALSYEMLTAIAHALDQWEHDDAVKLVMIEGEGERAFCAGGDIQLLYKTGRSAPEFGRKFWFDEYRLNARIHHYAKPYAAIMDGIVMGGGVGISAHGSHRIVTERSAVTMPEAGIGFMPDVGSTRLLADAPGETGMYLGLTASRMKAADAIYAGFADTYVQVQRLPDLKQSLAETGDVSVIARFAETPPLSDLALHRKRIDHCFGQPSLAGVLTALEASANAWEAETLKALRRVSPFSAAATFAAIRHARGAAGLEPCLTQEFRFAYRSLASDEFFEGIRAAVIDKDRKPHWQPARIEDVRPESVASVFAPLGEQEWRPAG